MTERTWFKTDAGKALNAAARFVSDPDLKAAIMAEAEAREVAYETRPVAAPIWFAPEAEAPRYVTRTGPGGDEVQVRVN